MIDRQREGRKKKHGTNETYLPFSLDRPVLPFSVFGLAVLGPRCDGARVLTQLLLQPNLLPVSPAAVVVVVVVTLVVFVTTTAVRRPCTPPFKVRRLGITRGGRMMEIDRYDM
jgi:hypothetical protein